MNIYVLIILCCALSLLISYLYHNSNDNYKIINKLSNIFLQLNKHVEIFKSNYIVVPSSIISLNHTGFYSFQQYLMKQGIQLPHNISFDFDYHIVNEYFEHINSIVIPDYFNKTITTTSSIAGRMTFLDYINSTNRMKLLEYINHTSSNINLQDYFNTTSLHLRGYYDASLDLQDYYYKAAQNFSLHRAFNTSVSSSSSLSYLQLHDILNSTENNINEYILDYIMHANNHRIDSASTTKMNKKITATTSTTTTTALLSDKLEEKINKFQWIFYLKMNPDILAKGMITTYELALEHYIQKGYKQRRWCNVNEQPSEYACLLGKDVIPLQLFLKRCNYQQNIIIKNKLRSIIQQLHNNSSISSSRSKKQTDNQIMKDQISGDNNSIDNNNNNNNNNSSSSSSTSSDINNSNNNHSSLQQKLKVFDYKFYLKMNPDLTKAGILTKQRAIEHYKKSGYHRNRWSNSHEKPSLEACARVRKFLEAKEFLLYCNLFSTSSISTTNTTTTSSTTLSSLLPSATTTSSSSSSSTSSSSYNVTDNTNKEIKDPITINPIFPLDVMKAKIENLIQQKLSSDSNNSSSIMSNSSVDIIDSKPTTTSTTITTTTPVLLNASIIKATSLNEKTITTTNVSDSNTVTDNHIVVVENIHPTTKNTTEILTFIDDSMAVPIPSNWTLQMSKSNNSNNHHTGIFDWRFYLKFNPDLSLAGITTEIQAKKHYYKYGSMEGRWSNAYELPTESACIRMIDFVPIEEFSKYCTYSIFDRETLQKRMNHRLSTFDWEFYLKYNPDLISLKLITQQHAIAHYKRYGFYERRWSCYEELPSLSACIRAKSILTTDEFINKCSIDNNDHNNSNSNSNSSKNSYNKNNVGLFKTNNLTTPIVNNEIITKTSIRVDNYNNTAAEKVDNTNVQTINKGKGINNELPTNLQTLSVNDVTIKVDNSTINKRDVITKHENVTTVVNKEVTIAEDVSITKEVGEEVGVVKN